MVTIHIGCEGWGTGKGDGEPSFISMEGGLGTCRVPVHILPLPLVALHELSVGKPWLRWPDRV